MQQHALTAISGYPLSPQQRRLWRARAHGFELSARARIAIDGELDLGLLAQAVHDLARDHCALTMRFGFVPGLNAPIQIPAETLEPQWHYVDLAEVPLEDQERRLVELASGDRMLPIDIEHGPIMHTTVTKLAAGKHAMLLQLSGLCADAWTMARLPERIARYYAARREGGAVERPDLDYLRFSEWQNELLSDEDAEEGLAFWRNVAAEQPAPLELPYARRPAGERVAPGVLRRSMPAHVQALIDEFASRRGTQAEALLLACWQALLWRLSGRPSITVAVRHAGRVYDEFADVVGVFARHLPVTGRMTGSQSFVSLLTQLERTLQQTRDWQEYFPADAPGSDLGSDPPPGSRVGFAHEAWPAAPAVSGSPAFSLQRVDVDDEPFDLELSCVDADGSLSTQLVYNADLFSEQDVARIMEQLHGVLAQVARDPHRPLRTLDLLDATEHRRMLATARRSGPARSVDPIELFRRQAAQHPDRIACSFGGRYLGYGELEARSNQLAHHLLELGCGAETIVALCCDRSLEMLVGILGVWKAGGAYLPVEPLPQERAERMLIDAGAHALLFTESLGDYLPAFAGPSICLERDWRQIARQPTTPPDVAPDPAHLAYVICTSGSTGRPKGVMIERHSVVNLLDALQRDVYDEVCPGEALRIGLNAPLVFDASVKQVVQLLAGHTLCVVPDDVRPDGARLLAFAHTQQLDALDATPTQLDAVLTRDVAESLPSLPRIVLLGGEAIGDAAWRRASAVPTQRYFNVYGPTECTVDATVCSVHATAAPSIGRPIHNCAVYVVDHTGKAAPACLPGELHIGGAGLARGYLNDPARTAERFVPDPWSGTPGSRLYRTGDLGWADDDGLLRYIGRCDHQLKLRGYRIELGEVEAALGEHPLVERCVATVREDTANDARLVAYVVPHTGAIVPITELRECARRRLPEYMVPSAFVQLAKWPQTRNGKLDRSALPPPDNIRQIDIAYVPPRSEAEQTIATIWREVLGVDKVGAQDNFFDLGGHSLLMVQVHSRLREAFDRELSLIEMFRNPTVRSLASYFSSDEPRDEALSRARHRAEKRQRARRYASRTPSSEPER